jgi:hypothetical protein
MEQPRQFSQHAGMLWARTALSVFLLQGPISAFVGAFRIGTKYEDVTFAEDLDAGTC